MGGGNERELEPQRSAILFTINHMLQIPGISLTMVFHLPRK
jgi:hypothetical protein